MQKIERIELKLSTEWTLCLPEGSRVVKVDIVNSKPYMWVISDTDEKNRRLEEWLFYLAIDGENKLIPSGFRYTGTYIMDYGTFIGHLFSKKS